MNSGSSPESMKSFVTAACSHERAGAAPCSEFCRPMPTAASAPASPPNRASASASAPSAAAGANGLAGSARSAARSSTDCSAKISWPKPIGRVSCFLRSRSLRPWNAPEKMKSMCRVEIFFFFEPMLENISCGELGRTSAISVSSMILRNVFCTPRAPAPDEYTRVSSPSLQILSTSST